MIDKIFNFSSFNYFIENKFFKKYFIIYLYNYF